MKKKIRIFALLLVVAMLLSAFAYAHEETDSAKIHLTGETLSEADDVQAIGNRAIFISTQNKIASVDDSQQEYVAEYVPEYQIEFAIPYQNKGVMIGSEKPTMVACPNALCKDEYELSWEGTYEYFDLTTGAVRAIRDPNTFYIAATSVGLTDQSNYTTTINGKAFLTRNIPQAAHIADRPARVLVQVHNATDLGSISMTTYLEAVVQNALRVLSISETILKRK